MDWEEIFTQNKLILYQDYLCYKHVVLSYYFCFSGIIQCIQGDGNKIHLRESTQESSYQFGVDQFGITGCGLLFPRQIVSK